MFSATGIFEKVMKPKVSFVLMPYVLFMALIGIYFVYSVAHFMGGGNIVFKNRVYRKQYLAYSYLALSIL